MLRRFTTFVFIACLSTVLLFILFQTVSWKDLPQAIGLGEMGGPTQEEMENALPDLRTQQPPMKEPPPNSKGFQDSGVAIESPYPVGTLKPAGSNYTKTLVLPSMQSEDTSWVEAELGDLITSGLLNHAIYVVDDPSAKLRPPENKGHEVMVYLTYIIDHYDELSDISIFMHAHRWSWHNNELMELDSAEMVRLLSPQRVTREGYMNLRCHWEPGCPTWLHPGAVHRSYDRPEEWLVADSWAEIFPNDPIPTVLAQPCCAQFAVSRDRIRELPKQRYVSIRDWLIRTELTDYLSGRVFEYVWQYIFTASAIHCPSMNACYCDGYGLCFGSNEKFDEWFELRLKRNELDNDLKTWEAQAEVIANLRAESETGQVPEEAVIEVPEAGIDKVLRDQIDQISQALERRKKAAVELGKDPKQRALGAGREWHEGDGF
ncbi:Hypothetical protein R9X50_00043200 [Acrodontium crateriforme]|uniref:Uncharacterized protein n=1 Tax=Acrodontium crateriforme TaxID=150365 RepID=A0AAQ3M0A4_9PEZI|nr:Hypothetical protein R9X50_00043200 [Acrodontium crateriforme]